MSHEINLPLNASLDLESGNYWVNGKLLTQEQYLLAIFEKNTPNFKFALDPNLPEYCEKHNKLVKNEKDLLTPEMFAPISNSITGKFSVRCFKTINFKLDSFFRCYSAVKIFLPENRYLIPAHNFSLFKRGIITINANIYENNMDELDFLSFDFRSLSSNGELYNSNNFTINFGDIIGDFYLI